MESYDSAATLVLPLRRLKEAGGDDPWLLGLTMGRPLDRTFGVRPRASRIVHALGLDQIHNIIAQQDRQSKRLDLYGLGAST